jgi:UDP-3-O-[3-hydroxymyristoyl] glucosamine N-acyltransferase
MTASEDMAQAVNTQAAEKNKAIKRALDEMAQQGAAQVRSLASGKNMEQLKLMALVLDDMQQVYEPIRDAILDEKARITGWAQCAEQFVKIIADRAASYKHQALAMAKQAELEKKPAGNGVRKRKTSRKKEVKTVGDDSAPQQRGST